MKVSSVKLLMLAVLATVFSVRSLASAVITIIPLDNHVSVFYGDSIDINYSIQNTSGLPLHSLEYIPPLLTAFVGSDCSGFLQPQESCMLTVRFEAKYKVGTYNLGRLVVCAFGGSVCSGTLAQDDLWITIVPD